MRQIAAKHGAVDKTVYAALAGRRPGRDPKVRAAVKEIEQLARRLTRHA